VVSVSAWPHPSAPALHLVDKSCKQAYSFDDIQFYGCARANMSLIQAENLTKVYGKGETAVAALDHVSLSLDAGEFVAVMGPSGCGKSTLLHLLGGLDHPTEGKVVIDSQSIAALSDTRLTELRRRKIGFVFQFYNLIPVLNATENAALPITLDGANGAKAKTQARDWLKKVGLGDRLNSRPNQLSGGQQQRVAVARALVADPKLILADEPTGNLDSKASDEIAALLRQVANEWGRAVVMVTHDPRLAAYADRILFLKDGAIVDETHLDAQNIGNAVLVADKIKTIS
jgi:putative ABC transport system ATP-binding protein